MTDSNDDDRGRPLRETPAAGRGDRPARKPPASGGPRQPRPEGARRERPHAAVPDAETREPAEDRVAKVIARAGAASRRDAEVLISEGRVTLNGETLASPAVNVTSADRIAIDGEPLPAKERTRLWIFHKPRGLVTTARDPEGRPTVFQSLPEDMPRAVAVGRLDINTEGLLLLTNDGGLARTIAHPDTGWLRRYKVRAHGEVTQADLDKLRDGITLDEIAYGPIEARLDRVQGDNLWLTLGLREGKNREIKRVLEHLGLQVNRLIRLSFGPFQLGDLEPGLVEEVKTKVLREQLGQTLAEAAGVDFESPVREPIAPFGSKKQEQRQRDTRAARSERPAGPRREGPRERRFGRDQDGGRPARARDDRGPRERDAPRRNAAPSNAPGTRGAPSLEPRRLVWRAEEPDDGSRRGTKVPRRGQDPREARAATAERRHERVGAIERDAGRKVVVERLVSDPERPERRPRTGAPGRSAPGGDDRPRRRNAPDGAGRDAPPPRFGRDRPPRDAGAGERPPRRVSRDGDPAQGRDRPRAAGGRDRGGGRSFGGGSRAGGSRSDFREDRPDRPRSGSGPRGQSGEGYKGRDARPGRSEPGGSPRPGPKPFGPKGAGPGRGGPRGAGPKAFGPRSSGPDGPAPRGAGPRGAGPKGAGATGGGFKGGGPKGSGPKRPPRGRS